MANILILKDNNLSNTSSKLHKELNNIGLDQYEARNYDDLVFDMKSNQPRVWFDSDGTDLASYDLVYMRDPKNYVFERHACAIYLNSKNKKFINRESLDLPYRNKLNQCMKFSVSGSKIPHTLFCQNNLIAKQFKEQKFNFPLILKSIVGKCGENNFLIKDQAELEQNLHQIKDVKCLIQEYIPNNYDYRVIVFEGDIVCAYERDRPNNKTHLNNVSLGGVRKLLVDVSEDISKMAIDAANQHGRNLCGVDIIVHKETGQVLVLETNANFEVCHRDKDDVEDTFYESIANKLHGLTK